MVFVSLLPCEGGIQAIKNKTQQTQDLDAFSKNKTQQTQEIIAFVNVNVYSLCQNHFYLSPNGENSKKKLTSATNLTMHLIMEAI